MLLIIVYFGIKSITRRPMAALLKGATHIISLPPFFPANNHIQMVSSLYNVKLCKFSSWYFVQIKQHNCCITKACFLHESKLCALSSKHFVQKEHHKFCTWKASFFMIWNIVHFQVGISCKVSSTNSTLKWFVSFMNWNFVHFQVRISFKVSTTNSTLKWIVPFMNWFNVSFVL